MGFLSFDHGIVAFLALVGFSLIALGGQWTSKRMLLRGLAGVGAGAVLLVALTTRIYPALTNPVQRVERSDQAQTLRLQKDVDALRGERDRAIEQANAAIADRRRVELQSAEGLARIRRALDETLTRFDGPQSPLRVQRQSPRPETAAEMIISDLSALKSAEVVRNAPPTEPPAATPVPQVQAPPQLTTPVAAPVVTTAPTTPPQATLASASPTPAERAAPIPAAAPTPAPKRAPDSAPKTIEALRGLLATPVERAGYRIKPLDEAELIAGQRGTYYTVEIKDLETSAPFLFGSARYTFPDGTLEFRRALTTFMSDIIAPLEGSKPYQLYVRGRADRLNYVGRLEPSHPYREIDILKVGPGQRYTAPAVSFKVDDVIRNRDLPNLRAAFLQSVIGEAYPKAVPDILDGIIASRREDAQRNAELILFVGW
jgi:hypothetical protein